MLHSASSLFERRLRLIVEQLESNAHPFAALPSHFLA